MLATHATSSSPSATAAAASSSAAPTAPKTFDALTTHRVSTIGFVGVQTSEAHARRKARRNATTPMTRAERDEQKKGDWVIREPNDAIYASWVRAVIKYMREKQDRHQVYVAVTNGPEEATGGGAGGARSMALATVRDALDITFAEIGDEDARWAAFQEYFNYAIRLNAEGTAIVFGDFVARPIAVRSDKVAVGRLTVQYVKDPAKASFTKASTLAHASQEVRRTVARAIITDLPATLPCGHHVPLLSDSWSAPVPERTSKFCVKCLDPVIDFLQRVHLPAYTNDEWAAWIEAEAADAVLDRLAALADLRGFPWLSREWLQVVRMVGIMFGVNDPYAPEFAATMAVSTNARLELVDKSPDASRVLERLREEVVRTFVWPEDSVALSGPFVTHLFDWVEKHGRDTFIESRADLYWYLDQFCALASFAPADKVHEQLPKLPARAGHTRTAASVSAKYAPLEQTCTAVAARLLQSDPSTPRSRRSRFSTATSSSSSDSTASWLSELSELVAGRLRSRTVSAQPPLETIAQAHEVGGEAQGELVSGMAGVTIGERAGVQSEVGAGER